MSVPSDLLDLLTKDIGATEEGLTFVTTFAKYLLHDARKDFVVDADSIHDHLGLPAPIAVVKAAMRFLHVDIDFVTADSKTKMTVQGLKNLCVCLGTDAAKRVRDRYMDMEEVMLEYTKTQLSMRQEELSMRQEELSMRQEELSMRQEELDRLKEKTFEMVPRYESVYVHKAAAELHSDRHKIGKSLDPRRRESQLNTSLAQGGKILYSIETFNAEIVEKAASIVLKRYHYWREHYQCQIEHSVNVLDVLTTVIDTLASCYQHIGRAELFDRVTDALQQIKTPAAARVQVNDQVNKVDDQVDVPESTSDRKDQRKESLSMTGEKDPLEEFLDAYTVVTKVTSDDDFKLSRSAFVKRQDLVNCLMKESPFGPYLRSLSRTDLNAMLDKAMAARGCPFREDTNAMGGHRLRRVYRGCALRVGVDQ